MLRTLTHFSTAGMKEMRGKPIVTALLEHSHLLKGSKNLFLYIDLNSYSLRLIRRGESKDLSMGGRIPFI